MSLLFTPFQMRDVTLRNRVIVAPMCQYSAKHGVANDWHLVHLGRFALGGFGLVMVEATGVSPEARISYADMGLWDDEQEAALSRVAGFLKSQGATPAIQIAHAGRKASTPVPWRGGVAETADEKAKFGFEHWVPVAPSAIPHSASPDFQVPTALDKAGIQKVVADFAASFKRADRAGFEVAEIHAAHGYLLNQFLSTFSNTRTDEYGGSRINRMRLLLEVAEAARASWPKSKPLWARISVVDGKDGWSVEDSLALVPELKARGADVIHCTTGGFDGTSVKPAAHYQVPFAAALRKAGLPTVAVGLIQEAQAAENVLKAGEADLIALARGALEDPNWAVHAYHILDQGDEAYKLWPKQAAARLRDKDRTLGIRGFAGK
jgi:2,4-dienoyl-CoA reductase-like NADH-dependent reductase (Old Yellow Enzyme family)